MRRFGSIPEYCGETTPMGHWGWDFTDTKGVLRHLVFNVLYRGKTLEHHRAYRNTLLFTRRRGANTAHTQMGRPTHEAPTREYTHKHTQTQTNAQRGPTKYGAGSRRGAALLIRGGRLAPTPSELHLCRDLPRRSYMCTATERRCACSASHVDVDQLTSFSYYRLVSLFRTLSYSRVNT